MLTVTIGPARPRYLGLNSHQPQPSPRCAMALAKLAARHRLPTTMVDGQGGAMVLDDRDGDVELF